MIRQDQIRQHAGFVEETSEARDERNLEERFLDSPRWWCGENRIDVVDEQNLQRRLLPAEGVSCKLPQCGTSLFSSGTRVARHVELRHEGHAAGRTDAAKQSVEGVHRERGKQSVRMREDRTSTRLN